ncbi:MAG: PhnD/SsuA/transferrin family substrate-binding protein [Phycisphaerae bacterium]
MNRYQASAAAVVFFLAAAGCQPRWALESRIQIGTTKAPVIGFIFVPREYLALHPKLEELFGCAVLFNPVLGPKDIAAHLTDGSWQFGILSSGEYMAIRGQSGIQPVASAVFENGQSVIKGVIVASAGSDVNTLADCKGKRFAFGPAHDLLYDYATRAALRSAGIGDKDLATEIPPISLNGRLHRPSGKDVARVVAFDLTIPAGVIDEITFRNLPDKGGSLITGPSKDMFRMIGGTASVPGAVVVASDQADPVAVEKLRGFLTMRVKNEADICKQMGVSGFTESVAAAFDAAAQFVPTD